VSFPTSSSKANPPWENQSHITKRTQECLTWEEFATFFQAIPSVQLGLNEASGLRRSNEVEVG
jgi:hypothetical protein